MKGQGGDVTEADKNVILDMKRITGEQAVL